MLDSVQQFLTARGHSDNFCDRNPGIVKGVLRKLMLCVGYVELVVNAA